MEEEGRIRNRFTKRIHRRNGMTERVRPRRVFKPRDGPPPITNSKCQYIAFKDFKPQQYSVCYDNMDPAILACLQRLRTGTGPTSGTTGYKAQVKGGETVPNKDLGNSSETLVENLKLEDIHISN